MTTEDQIRDEKHEQHDINKEAAKISASSSGKIDKYEYLTGEEILPSTQKQILNKLNLLILLWEKPLKNKQKQLKIKEKNKLMLYQI